MKRKTKKIRCPLCQDLAIHEMSSNDLMFNKKKIYDYFLCRSCDLTFINPLPTLSEIKQFYPDSYMVFKSAKIKKLSYIEKVKLQYKNGYPNLVENNLLSQFVSLFQTNWSERIDYIKNGTFLDIGCGNGSRLLKMKRLGWDVTGVELNLKGYQECKKNNLNVFNDTLENLKFKKNSFDVIYISHVIEHVANPNEILRIVKNILKPNGQLLIKTPNRNSLGRKIFKKYWYHNDIPRHLFLFSKKSLIKLLNSFNMTLIFYSQDTSPKGFLNSIDYLLNVSKKSRRNKFFRLLSRFFIIPAKIFRMGDENFYIFKKIK